MHKLFSVMFFSAIAATAFAVNPGVDPGPGQRYATDAYPGFDLDDANLKPEVKEPRWFAWINGPKKENAKDQYAWCRACEAEGELSKACKGYDALVREWPTAPEAAPSQLRYAELLLEDLDYIEAFKAYRYLLDFYASACDFSAVVDKMYQVAELMREEGKTIMFFRFANTTEVRHAYESLVLRAPGAAFVRAAMLTIAGLREEDDQLPEAVEVYENLMNLYPKSDEARTAAFANARVRMQLVRRHEYNRNRVRDTADYLRLTLKNVALDEAQTAEVKGWIAEAEALMENEAWKGAAFYDSRTRTRRSAINALTVFLMDYPDGVHADEARARLAELKNGEANQ